MKRILTFLTVAMLSLSMIACGGKKEADTSEDLPFSISEEPISLGNDDTESFNEDEEENVEGKYRSELTNQWIDEELKDQRPIAVMVDNEIKALPHMGINQADVVYELVNSTLNGRITRLMVIVKDWNNIEQLGNVRSARTTNCFLAPEFNAILIHDGGPFYIDDYINRPYNSHLSGGFARIPNGKSYEYTEYVTSEPYKNDGKTYKSISQRIEDANISTEYTEYYPGEHFKFNNKDTELEGKDLIKAETIKMPFPHNESTLTYNADTKEYEYSEYAHRAGEGFKDSQIGPHIDPTDDNKVLSFKNVIIYSVTMNQLDVNGYMVYNVIGSGTDGYYITDGKAVPVTWEKNGEYAITEFKNKETGEDIVLNTGKTYIGIVPSDAWDDLSIK